MLNAAQYSPPSHKKQSDMLCSPVWSLYVPWGQGSGQSDPSGQ